MIGTGSRILRNMSSTKSAHLIEIGKLLSGIGSIVRWRILMALGKGEALPANVLAERARITPNAASKHLLLLRESGLLHRGYGRLYHIPKHFFTEDERALDFGAFVLRLDYPEETPPKSRARSA